jgi:hypothetical protein
MNNKKITKFHTATFEEVMRLDKKINQLTDIMTKTFNANMQRQAEMLIMNEALLNIIQAKGICTDEEIKAEFAKCQESLIQSSKEVQSNVGKAEVTNSDTKEMG